MIAVTILAMLTSPMLGTITRPTIDKDGYSDGADNGDNDND